MSRLTCLALLLSGCLISDEDLRGWAGDTAGSGKDVTLTIQDFINSMKLIPAQTFTMGCTEGQGQDCQNDENPVTVTLSQSFLIGDTEVTQAQWELVMGDNPSSISFRCGGSCPVDTVSWSMAADFANAVSTAEGLAACYDCYGTDTNGNANDCVVATNPYLCEGYRLPTEAEWEAAARCGQDTLYAGSNNADAVAWYSDNSDGGTHSVGTKKPNACGLYDMSGNVAEWTQDYWYDSYDEDPNITNPVGPESGDFRVSRGGSYGYGAWTVRVADRNGVLPEYRDSFYGLRLVRTNLD